MLPLSPQRLSAIGKPILRTFEILKIFRIFDNSSRTRAKARAKATARARQGQGQGRSDGRTDGRTELFI